MVVCPTLTVPPARPPTRSPSLLQAGLPLTVPTLAVPTPLPIRDLTHLQPPIRACLPTCPTLPAPLLCILRASLPPNPLAISWTCPPTSPRRLHPHCIPASLPTVVHVTSPHPTHLRTRLPTSKHAQRPPASCAPHPHPAHLPASTARPFAHPSSESTSPSPCQPVITHQFSTE